MKLDGMGMLQELGVSGGLYRKKVEAGSKVYVSDSFHGDNFASNQLPAQ